MASRNPLAKITHAAQGAASLPLKATEKVADRAVGVVAGGVRMAANLAWSTAERAKSLVGTEDEKVTPASPAPPAEPLQSVEEVAEAAVAREMAEEPQPGPTPSQAARATAPTRTPKPQKAAEPEPEPGPDQPLIDPAVAKTVKSETDILRAAADVDKDL